MIAILSSNEIIACDEVGALGSPFHVLTVAEDTDTCTPIEFTTLTHCPHDHACLRSKVLETYTHSLSRRSRSDAHKRTKRRCSKCIVPGACPGLWGCRGAGSIVGTLLLSALVCTASKLSTRMPGAAASFVCSIPCRMVVPIC